MDIVPGRVSIAPPDHLPPPGNRTDTRHLRPGLASGPGALYNEKIALEAFSFRGTCVIMQSPTPGPAVASAQHQAGLPTIGGRYFALTVLFSMNLLNYVDRYSFFAVGTDIQKDLHISDQRFGVLARRS